MSVIVEPSRPPAARAVYRVRQGLVHLWPSRDEPVDAELAALLAAEQYRLVSRLPFADRRHLLTVWRRLAALTGDPELLLAGLLHDAGKADGRVRARLSQRVLVVLLGRRAPRLLAALAQPSRFSWRQGLYLAVAHPRLGAELARGAGAGGRACWLIAHHHDDEATDPGLRLLRQIDEES